MTDKMFCYEEAEKILDDYAMREGNPSYQRSYRKLKNLVTAMAYTDFFTDGVPMKQAMAWTWEDVQIGFVGRGESIMSGAILQLWVFVAKANHEKFAAMIAKAFAAAEATTDPSVPRRYLTQWRNKPVRKSEDGFVDAPILPCWGPRVREWALSESRDPDEMEVQFAAMERQERNPATKRANLAAAKAASGFKKKSVKVTTGVKPSVTSGEQK